MSDAYRNVYIPCLLYSLTGTVPLQMLSIPSPSRFCRRLVSFVYRQNNNPFNVIQLLPRVAVNVGYLLPLLCRYRHQLVLQAYRLPVRPITGRRFTVYQYVQLPVYRLRYMYTCVTCMLTSTARTLDKRWTNTGRYPVDIRHMPYIKV